VASAPRRQTPATGGAGGADASDRRGTSAAGGTPPASQAIAIEPCQAAPSPACGGGLGRGSFRAQTPRSTRGSPPSQPSPASGGRSRRWPDASPGTEACVTGEEGVLVESREAIGARVKSHLRVALLPPRGRTRSSLPSPSRGSSLLPPPPAGEGWGGGRSERKHHAPLAVRPHPNLPPPSGEGVDVGLMQVQAPKLASRTRRACLSSRR